MLLHLCLTRPKELNSICSTLPTMVYHFLLLYTVTRVWLLAVSKKLKCLHQLNSRYNKISTCFYQLYCGYSKTEK